MPFIIDTDHLGGAAEGIAGPSGYKGNGSELTEKFRMLDDDGEVYYEGRSHCSSSFSPLDNFGRPNAGCASIEYWNATTGAWEQL